MEHFTLAQILQTNQKTNAGFKSTSLAEDTHKTRLHKKTDMCTRWNQASPEGS